MKSLFINNRLYTYLEYWEELQWKQFIALYDYAHPSQDAPSTLPSQRRETEPIQREKASTSNPSRVASARHILECMADVEPTYTDRCDPQRMVQFADSMVRRFLVRKEGGPPQREAAATLSDEAQELLPESRMPRTERGMDGESLPLYDTQAIEFCEASDLYAEAPWRYAPWIAALLCRPRQETYSEANIRRQAEKFRVLSMTRIFRVLRLLHNVHQTLRQLYPACYAVSQGGHTPLTHPTFTWSDWIRWGGHFDIREIQQLQQMPLYDFMGLMQSRILFERTQHPTQERPQS